MKNFMFFIYCIFLSSWAFSQSSTGGLVIDWDEPTTFDSGEPLPANYVDGYDVYLVNDDTDLRLARFVSDGNTEFTFSGLPVGQNYRTQVCAWSVTGCQGVCSDPINIEVFPQEQPISSVVVTVGNTGKEPENPRQICIDDPDCEVVE